MMASNQARDYLMMLKSRQQVLIISMIIYAYFIMFDFAVTLIAVNMGYIELSPITSRFILACGLPLNLMVPFMVLTMVSVSLKITTLADNRIYYPLIMSIWIFTLSHILGSMPFVLHQMLRMMAG